METEKIKALLKARGLQIHEVPSDGDCLFAGIAQQVQNRTVTELRKLVADTLLCHQDEFQPFLSTETDEEFQVYCQKMATLSSQWGGQVEITALSKALKRPIEVVQAEGPLVQVGHDEFQDKSATIVLTYHRHYYGLGEHYNSVKPLS